MCYYKVPGHDLMSKDIHISTLKVRTKRVPTMKVRRKRTPAMRAFADRQFNGPLPPGPLPPQLLPSMPRQPIPSPSSFSEPAMFPGGFGLMSYGRGDQPFRRARFQGRLINPGPSLSQHTKRDPPAKKEKDSGKQPINLTIHIHNPNDLKKLTQKADEVKKTKINIKTTKEISNIKKKLSRRKPNTRPLASTRLTFLDPIERVEKERAANAIKKGNDVNIDVERTKNPVLAKTIPNIQAKYSRPQDLNRNQDNPPLHLPVLKPAHPDVLSLKQSKSSIVLQMPSPKSLYLTNEGQGNANMGIPNQHLPAIPLTNNNLEYPKHIGLHGLPNGKRVNSNKQEQLHAPGVSRISHNGQYANSKIKTGLFEVPNTYGERNLLLEPKGYHKGTIQPASTRLNPTVAGENTHLNSVAYLSKPDPIVKDPNPSYKTIPPSSSNDLYTIEQFNNKKTVHPLQLLQNFERPNLPGAKSFTGQLQKHQRIENIPEIMPTLRTADYHPSNTGLSPQNEYNQMLLSLMIIMLQQQQIEKVRERINGKDTSPYLQHANQLPYQPTISPLPQATVLLYKQSKPPVPFQTAPPGSQTVNKNQHVSPYFEQQKILQSNQQFRQVLSVKQRGRLGNHIRVASPSLQNQMVISTLDQQLDGLYANGVRNQVSPAQITDYSNNTNVIPQEPLQNHNIQAKASAFEYPNELNVVAPIYTQNQGNVLFLRTNPIDKSVHIASPTNILGKGSKLPPSLTKQHFGDPVTVGHDGSSGQYSLQRHAVRGPETGQADIYKPLINQDHDRHQIKTASRVFSSIPEMASMSVPVSDYSKQNTQGSNTLKQLGLVLDVTDIKEKPTVAQGNPSGAVQDTPAQNIPNNDLNSKLDRLIAFFENQGFNSARSYSVNEAKHANLSPTSLTNPQLYEEILEQNAAPKRQTQLKAKVQKKVSKKTGSVVPWKSNSAVLKKTNGIVLKEPKYAVPKKPADVAPKILKDVVLKKPKDMVLKKSNGVVLKKPNDVILKEPNRAVRNKPKGVILKESNGAVLKKPTDVILKESKGMALKKPKDVILKKSKTLRKRILRKQHN